MNRHMFTALIGVLTATACVRADEAWNRFRGPNGTGVAPAADVPNTWTEADYRFRVELPGVGHSSPVVWGERIYLTSADPQSAVRTVLCLHTADGRTLWTRDFPSQPLHQHPDNNLASSTPCADGEGVVVVWTTAESVLMVALDPDGGELWRRDLGPFVGERGAGTSPIIEGDLVILANDQEDPNLLPENRNRPDPARMVGKSFVVALDRRTGQTRWKTDRRTGIAAYSTPCIYRDGGRAEVLLTSTGHGLSSHDLATGKLNWEVPDVFPDRCVASPVFAPGVVMGGYGFGVRGTKFFGVRPGTPDNGSRPEIAYELDKSLPVVPTPLVKGDRLYLWSDDGIVTCLGAATGEVVWRERIGGWFFASPICLGDRLFGVSKEGEVVVLVAADRFEVLGRTPLGEPCYATPAVADGVIYFRTRGHLIALGRK